MKILYIFLVVIIMSGCSDTTHGENQQSLTVPETDNSVYMETKDLNSIPKVKEFDFPVPSDVGKIISCKKNSLNTVIGNKQIMIEYYEELEKNNWKPLRTKTSDSPILIYFNGKDGLVIKDGMINEEMNREVVIDYYEGKNNISSYGNEYDDKIKAFLAEDCIYAISEYDIYDASKELGLRGFYAYTNKIEPAKIIIDKYGEITLINYDQFLVCDVDSDGEKEFVTRLGYGSGRYIITLSIWKYNHNIRKLEMAYRTQYEQIGSVDMFIKENYGNVEIVAGQWEKGDIVVHESYGKLSIKDGMLLPEKKDIPFKLLENIE